MKNQYVGDVNDYVKYGLLRLLSNGGAVRTMVCWMLTEDDGRNDGRFTQYLSQLETYRHFDPPLFDALAGWMRSSPPRNVRWAEESGILPSTQFFSDVVPDDPLTRRRYFDRFLTAAEGCDLVFFDPDNGLEVKSVPRGAKGSCKYLFWGELVETFCAGYSVLVFQSFRG